MSVNVTAKTETIDDGRVRVTFVVNEGERAGIAAINFTGNNAINGGTLKGAHADQGNRFPELAVQRRHL